jgi:hypothetical protein
MGLSLKMMVMKYLANSKRDLLRRYYWDLRAREIDRIWGQGTGDYHVLRQVLELVKPMGDAFPFTERWRYRRLWVRKSPQRH